jgi:2,4-dienoyl-CoA reductase-like NADH-dependent reductase (Old Yellow Enzyme family)
MTESGEFVLCDDEQRTRIWHLASLFRTFPFGQRMLRNRIAMAPMTRFHSPGGVPGEDVASYYARRARGGVGLIITEGTYIDHPAANGYDNVPAFHGEAALAGWARVVKAVHDAGTAIVPQLWHVGGQRRSGIEPDRSVIGCGPMDVVENERLVVRALTIPEINDIVNSYGRAARVAVEMGFDGVEIHGAHGYLLDEFLWSKSNKRSDEYGGSLERRTRFAVEVIARVKAELPAGMPLSLRISQWKIGQYDARIADDREELAVLLTPLVRAGVDIFHVSTRQFGVPAFPDGDKSLARVVREVAGRPVIGVGGVGLTQPHVLRSEGGHENARSSIADVAPVAAAIEKNDFDIVAVGRALLADPNWANKLREGRSNEINPLEPHHLKELC